MASTIESTPNAGTYWTRPYTPGTDNWIKEDELALKTGQLSHSNSRELDRAI